MPLALGVRIPLWLLTPAIIALLLGAVELGFRLGFRRARDGARAPSLTTITSAVLGLLALLLGFSFAMAETRYQTRRDLVLAETNAIGTTLLRAQLLPDPQRAEVEGLLERYLDSRIAFHSAGTNSPRVRLAAAEAERLQAELWTRGAAAAAVDRRATTTALFLQSLNEVIDLHAARIVALENRVPRTILLLLLFVACASGGFIGYGNGIAGARGFAVSSMMVLVFSAVMMLIVDLDRPDRGAMRVPQQSMLRLRHSLSVAPH
jgi:hypothetical protein